jgi:hypothetical protein
MITAIYVFVHITEVAFPSGAIPAPAGGGRLGEFRGHYAAQPGAGVAGIVPRVR